MEQISGNIKDVILGISAGMWLCAIAAVVNLFLCKVMYDDLERVDGRAFYGHAAAYLAFTAAVSALTRFDPKCPGFIFTFLLLALLPVGLGLVYMAMFDPDVKIACAEDVRKERASGASRARESRPTYYDRLGGEVELLNFGGGYTDWDGNPYRVSGSTAIPVRHLEMTDEGDYIYVTYENGMYYDDFNNQWKKYGGTLSRH